MALGMVLASRYARFCRAWLRSTLDQPTWAWKQAADAIERFVTRGTLDQLKKDDYEAIT